MLGYVLAVCFFATTFIATYVAVRFANRSLQMDEIITEVDGRVGELVEYCETLKAKSIAYHSPEVMQFHRLVVSIAAPLNKIRQKVEALNG